MKQNTSKPPARKGAKPVNLALDRILPGPQVRATINAGTVADYAEAMKSGAEFPPVDVFENGDGYYLPADGSHRVESNRKIGRKTILANIHTGSKSDALRFALSANTKHGLQRSNADKRRAVELALKEWPKLSDRKIAEICAVGYSLVADVRKVRLPDSGSRTPPARIGKDGRSYRMPARKPAPPPRTSAQPPAKPEPAKPGPKPKGPEDSTGLEIPKESLELWNLATNDVKETLVYAKSVSTRLKEAERNGNKIWRGTNFNEAITDAKNLIVEIEAMLPFAVCHSCNGVMIDDNCCCKGKGFVGEFFWKQCVPEEIRKMRGAK